jgi:hypothetical protein
LRRAGLPTDKIALERTASSHQEEAKTQVFNATRRHQSSETTSSTESTTNRIKSHKRLAVLGLLPVIIAAVALFFFLNRPSVLTEKDTILLADFVNTTGDPVFDLTLKQALAVQLGQTPFLNIYPDDRIQETLRLMNRKPDERITKDIAREICERNGLNAMLLGSIASLGNNYVITLEALNPRTGEALAREQIEAASKEEVLGKLGDAAMKLRGNWVNRFNQLRSLTRRLNKLRPRHSKRLKHIQWDYNCKCLGKPTNLFRFINARLSLTQISLLLTNCWEWRIFILPNETVLLNLLPKRLNCESASVNASGSISPRIIISMRLEMWIRLSKRFSRGSKPIRATGCPAAIWRFFTTPWVSTKKRLKKRRKPFASTRMRSPIFIGLRLCKPQSL